MESLSSTEKKFPRFTVTSSCKSVRHSNDPSFNNATNIFQCPLTCNYFGNSTEYLPMKLPEFPPTTVDIWKDIIDITSNTTTNSNTFPEGENVPKSDRQMNNMQELRSIITLRNESGRRIGQPEHELDLPTIRTSRQTDVHSNEIPHDCTKSEGIGQENVCREPPFRRPNTLHLDPLCDRSKPGRSCNTNGISNTASPKISPRTKYIVKNENQDISNDVHEKDDRISRMQTVVEELTRKMCNFCVKNSNIFANLEESMRIVTHLRSIVQIKENCKHDKILQFDSSTWDCTSKSVIQSDSSKQGTFDGVVRRSTQFPQPENGLGYTDFDFVHSDLLKPSDSVQNLALIVGKRSLNGSTAQIVDDGSTESDIKNKIKRKNTLTISSVLFRNSDEDRDCNSRGSLMKNYFRRTSRSRERME